MYRDVLERMTKEELMELIDRQNRAINSLDMERYDANAVIDHLVTATENMRNLRYHDAERDHDQEYLDEYVRQMYEKYPNIIVAERPNCEVEKEKVVGVGKWVVLRDEYGDVVEAVCSLCEMNGNHTWQYCPHCGAKMERSETE